MIAKQDIYFPAKTCKIEICLCHPEYLKSLPKLLILSNQCARENAYKCGSILFAQQNDHLWDSMPCIKSGEAFLAAAGAFFSAEITFLGFYDMYQEW